MKAIGLLGGMSWESTIPYYRLINEGIKQRLGGLHSAQVLLHSVDFHEIEECQRRGEWDKTGDILAEAALGLQRAGAEGIVLCTNTMHKVADAIESRCSLPFLHIADATGRAITGAGMTRVVINKNVVAGDDFTIRHGVTIGNRGADNMACPHIGNGVELGANVIILGDITLGNNVTVGAGSVVLDSVPDNALVVGEKARVKVIK